MRAPAPPPTLLTMSRQADKLTCFLATCRTIRAQAVSRSSPRARPAVVPESARSCSSDAGDPAGCALCPPSKAQAGCILANLTCGPVACSPARADPSTSASSWGSQARVSSGPAAAPGMPLQAAPECAPGDGRIGWQGDMPSEDGSGLCVDLTSDFLAHGSMCCSVEAGSVEAGLQSENNSSRSACRDSACRGEVLGACAEEDADGPGSLGDACRTRHRAAAERERCGETPTQRYSVDRPAAQHHATPASARVVHQQSTGAPAALLAQAQLRQSTLSSLLQQCTGPVGMERQCTAPSGCRATCGSSKAASSLAAQRHGLPSTCPRPLGSAGPQSSTCARLSGPAASEQGRMAPITAAMRAFGERTTCSARQGVSCCGTAGVERTAMPGMSGAAIGTCSCSHGQACWQRTMSSTCATATTTAHNLGPACEGTGAVPGPGLHVNIAVHHIVVACAHIRLE